MGATEADLVRIELEIRDGQEQRMLFTRLQAGGHPRLTPEDMQQLGGEFGLECLSPETGQESMDEFGLER